MPHDPHEPDYSLDELTARAETTPRTVRYYIAEGLLPPAVSAGPKSGYTDAHLDRLRLIARLKEAYLPLREIRRRVGAMTDEEVRETLDTLDQETSAQPEQPLDSAASYIANVLHATPPPAVHLADAMAQPPSAADTWRRLPITSEAELLIRDELYRRRSDQIDALIAWARRVLS